MNRLVKQLNRRDTHQKKNKRYVSGIAVLLTVIPFIISAVVIEYVFLEESGYCGLLHERVQALGADSKSKTDNSGTEKREASTKKVALTFDDGPNPDYTPQLLDGLKERNVKVTFFLLGKSVEDSPELTKRIYEEGHLIGNHTYDHVNLGNLCEGAACDQVEKTNEIIETVTGYYPEYVRPPFGEWRENIDKDMTMIKVLWNVDPLDWATNNSDAVVQRVIKRCDDNDIILMHDASKSSVCAALQIIDILQQSGYEFVTVDQLILD